MRWKDFENLDTEFLYHIYIFTNDRLWETDLAQLPTAAEKSSARDATCQVVYLNVSVCLK